jgi:signal transduction histidine kinase
LPAITQRLAATLDKLQRPGAEITARASAQDWWDGLVRLYQGRGVEFSVENLGEGAEVPRALFDSVADNLLQNALAKQQREPGMHVRATLSGGEAVGLRVCDTGNAVPADMAKSLLRVPVPSDSGLGIGLYQAAQQAAAAGYLLRLESNRDGEVCFALRRTAA